MALETAAWVAIFFLMFGLFLVFLEVLNPGFFIAVPGGTLAFMGAIGLAAPELMFGRAGWFLWPSAALVASLANLWVYRRWAPAAKAPLTLVADSLPGQVGVVVRPIAPGDMKGKVRIKGTVWSARSATAIPVGAEVRVVSAEGVHVVVELAGPKA